MLIAIRCAIDSVRIKKESFGISSWVFSSRCVRTWWHNVKYKQTNKNRPTKSAVSNCVQLQRAINTLTASHETVLKDCTLKSIRTKFACILCDIVNVWLVSPCLIVTPIVHNFIVWFSIVSSYIAFAMSFSSIVAICDPKLVWLHKK